PRHEPATVNAVEAGRVLIPGGEDPRPRSLPREEGPEPHAREVGGRGGDAGSFHLAGPDLPRRTGNPSVDVAQRGPFGVEQLDRAMGNVTEQQRTRIPGRDDDDVAARRVTRSGPHVESGS